MNLVKFNRGDASFDRYDRFAYERDGFLMFESGEVCYTRASTDPCDRKHYGTYGVTIFMPGDSHAPKLFTKEGENIPTAQLDINGKPHLLWDHRNNMVVRLAYQRDCNTQVPRDLRHFPCYWASEDSKPIAKPISYAPPNSLTKEQREYVATFSKIVPTVLAMRIDNPEIIRLANVRKPPTQADIQAALEGEVSPMRFLEQFEYGVMRHLQASPVGALQRAVKTVPYVVTKS